jgi:hypothetical protein
MGVFPGATWVGGVPQSNYSPAPGPKIGQVVHVIVGLADSAISEFQNPNSQLSAHFVVAGPGDPYPDGTIFQLLDTDACCYAQGAGNYPPTAYIAVENSGFPTTPMSVAQCESNARILAWASKLHQFPITGPVSHGTPGLTPHCNPDGTPDPSWGNHTCPGTDRLAQIAPIVALARTYASPVTTADVWSLLAMPTPDQNLQLRVLYRLCLHREEDIGGWETYSKALDAGTMTMDQIMAAMQDGTEGQAVIAAERKVLGLPPV